MTPDAALGAVLLLVEDPDLGAGLPPDQLAQAERLVVLPGFTVPIGVWDIGASHAEPTLGLVVLDGLVTVNIVLADRVASHLAGPGDVILACLGADALVPAAMTHFVSETTRIAVLDRTFIAAVRRWPVLLLTLHERLRSQERRLAVHAAIGTLRRVEDRVLALLWHLAERWGRMTPEGVVVPLCLTHETLGRLAGAARPTVSLALGELTKRGQLSRRPDGAFVLQPGSAEALRPGRSGAPKMRPLTVAEATGEPGPAFAARRPGIDGALPRPIVDVAALQQRIAALHEDLPVRTQPV